VPKLDLFGTSRPDPLVVEEAVAALGFAVERQFDRDVFSKFPRQFENLAGIAALEFQFDFADGSGSAPCTDLPFVERDLDSGSIPAHRSDGAANSRLENRHELVLEFLGQQRFQRGALNFAEIGNVAFDLAFPFPAAGDVKDAIRKARE
jgi:hypothetical protein